jgi:acetyl esterase/lipase
MRRFLRAMPPIAAPFGESAMIRSLRTVALACLLSLPSSPTLAATAQADVRVLHDVAYGKDPLQKYDVYLPAHAKSAPVIFMVHGGGWRRGDKAMPNVVDNKVSRWVSRGFVFVSVDYRLLPTPVEVQVDDVARALASAQSHAAEWGADSRKFVLMGHSAGAHLVALLDADPARAKAFGARPWLGAVSLDSAALDIPATMKARHFRLYDAAFGKDPATWARLSPMQQLRAGAPPMLLVCSTQRRDSCPQARALMAKAQRLGDRAKVLGENLRHGEINAQLGLDGDYTRAVENFLSGLDPAIASRLAKR